MSAEPAYSAIGTMIHKAPVHTKLAEGGTSITLGFPVCEVTEWVGAEQASTVADLLCRGEQYDAVVDVAKALRQHLALFCGPDDAIATELFSIADEALSRIPDIQIKGAA